MIFVTAVAAFLAGSWLSSSVCDVRERDFKQPDGFTINWVEYTPRKLDPSAATIFILPPTGGTTPLDRRYAKGFCKRGRRALIVEKWSDFDESAIDLDLHNRLFGRANRALTTLTAQYPGRLHFLGTSLGALFTISAMAHISRIEAAALIVGGVPFSEIIVASDTQDMNYLRRERREKFGFRDNAEYLKALEAIYKWNDLDKLTPEKLADKKVLLVEGMKDKGVPTENQLELEKRLPQAKVIRHSGGHLSTIIKSFAFDYYDIIRALL